jgi:hypothetical protein
MRKYVSDVSVDDVLRIGDRTVVLDYMEVRAGSDRVLLRGYYEDDGSDYSLVVSLDHIVNVEES